MSPNNLKRVAAAIREIRKFYETGRASLQDHPGAGPYRGWSIQEGARRLGISPEHLRKAREFAKPAEGYTPEEVKALCASMREHQQPLGTSHVICLLAVAKDHREDLQRQVIEGGWSVSKLKQAIRLEHGSRKQGGRRPYIPKDREEFLAQLESECVSWRRWYVAAQNVYGGEGRLVLKTLPQRMQKALRETSTSIKGLLTKVSAELARANPGRMSPVESPPQKQGKQARPSPRKDRQSGAKGRSRKANAVSPLGLDLDINL